MTKELEKERRELLDSEKAYEEALQFFNCLPLRITADEERLANVRVQLQNCREDRSRILKAVSLAQLEESELEKNAAMTCKLEVQIKAAEDVLTELVKLQQDQQAKIQKLAQNVAGKRHSFWNSICQHELEKVKKDSAKLISPLLRAWAASCLSGISQNMGGFLASKVQWRQIDIPDTDAIQESLVKEYLGRKEEAK